jgi:ABC-type multidrug transport system permease subunit
VVLQIATTFATAMSLVRERERGTLEQLLVSPLSRWGLMLGKLLPYFLIGLFMAAVLFGVMHRLFLVPIAGSIVALWVATALYVFALLSLGLLLSTRAQNQMQALQFSMIFVMPSVFFSGFIFPRETMPWIFRAIGSCLPTTYFIELSARSSCAAPACRNSRATSSSSQRWVPGCLRCARSGSGKRCVTP